MPRDPLHPPHKAPRRSVAAPSAPATDRLGDRFHLAEAVGFRRTAIGDMAQHMMFRAIGRGLAARRAADRRPVALGEKAQKGSALVPPPVQAKPEPAGPEAGRTGDLAQRVVSPIDGT